jgi:HAD superfamily hydrolase (TIGR01549 family)
MSDLNKIKIIVFDLDGTLVDTMGGFADIAARLIAENYGLTAERARAEYMRTSGMPFFKQLNALFPYDKKNAEVATQFEMDKLDVRRTTVISDDTRLALRELKKKYPLAISSNNYERNVREFVKSENIDIDFSLGFQTGISSKGKKHFKFLCDTLKVRPDEILFIGDSLSDAKVSAECGVNFIAKLGTFEKDDFKKISSSFSCIRQISELKNLL